MPNPYAVPRPCPISPERLHDGESLTALLGSGSMRSLLQNNTEWLCFRERSTLEIYEALYGSVDPRNSRQREGMEYLNQALWELGFRTVGEEPHPTNPSWKSNELA